RGCRNIYLGISSGQAAESTSPVNTGGGRAPRLHRNAHGRTRGSPAASGGGGKNLALGVGAGLFAVLARGLLFLLGRDQLLQRREQIARWLCLGFGLVAGALLRDGRHARFGGCLFDADLATLAG